MATKIGCDSLVYAVMTAEDTVNSSPTYGVVKAATGVMSIGVNPNASQETLFADDGPMETATTLGKIEVEIKKNELTTENKADLLGHAIDGNGGLVYGDSDVPPFVAIGFRALKSNGNYRYCWLYKGRFMDPEDQNETKGDGVNFQADTIKGQFVKLNKSMQAGGKLTRMWKYELDGDYPGANVDTMENWFKSVTMPSENAATPAPNLTVSYAAGSVVGSTKATVTAGDSNHLAYAVNDASVTAPSAGSLVTGAITYTAGNNITGVAAGKHVAMYELSADNRVVKFNDHTLVVSEIKE